MHRIKHWSRQPTLAAIAASSLIALGLGACGGSAKSTTTATQANVFVNRSASHTATNDAKTGKAAAGATAKTPLQRPSALRECLQRNGVKLPAERGARGLSLNGGLSKAASGQLRAAMRKCLGAGGPPRSGPGRFLHTTGSSRFKQALSDFAACLRKNGVNLPAPNTSGNGPVFSTKGVNTASAQFRAAATKCRPALIASFRAPRAARKPAG
jgi:hypothetical protein